MSGGGTDSDYATLAARQASLEFVGTTELLNELVRRHDNTIFVATTALTPDDGSLTYVRCGDLLKLLGLIDFVKINIVNEYTNGTAVEP